MKVKTSELEGEALDWVVWSIEFKDAARGDDDALLAAVSPFNPSAKWSQGRPLIDKGLICTKPHPSRGWSARGYADARVYHGKTLLIAAMRCFVSENLGEEVDVPDNLKGVQSESNPD